MASVSGHRAGGWLHSLIGLDGQRLQQHYRSSQQNAKANQS
jgi:hypothetical protein